MSEANPMIGALPGQAPSTADQTRPLGMKRINTILVALLVVQIGLGAAVLLGRREVTIAKSQKVFAALDPEKVTRLEVNGPKGVDGAPATASKVVLANDGAVWRFPDADGYPADAAKVKDLVEKLAKLEARGVVVTEKKHHGRLQVKDDAYQRLVKVTVDGKELAFFLGSTAGTNGVYLRKQGEDAVFPVDGIRTWDIGDNVSAWLTRDYLKVEPGELWSVKIENEKGTIELEKGTNGEWALGGAGAASATNRSGSASAALDKPAIDDLVRKASNLQLEEPAGRALKPEYGLDKPIATVTIVTGKPKEGGAKPGQTTTLGFRVGAKIEASNRYYVKSSASDYVVQVASWGVDTLLTKAKADLFKKEEKTPLSAPAAGKAKKKP